ncbi:toxin [Streptomyces sp. NRRL F-4707]|nr:toxin [Streptomyces sp. NRRL F-4711]KOX29875.1 toxin [Streptomyces sp. NRRL F-4707]
MASRAMPTTVQWRKSSYSSDQGGECVECAPLGLLAWRKSSYSGDQGGNCVEVGELPTTVAVRDSKTPAGPVLTLAPAAFTTFVGWARTTHK